MTTNYERAFAQHSDRRLASVGTAEHRDQEPLDVVLAAAARCFFSKTLDGVGALPDASYAELAPELLDVLAVGKPIADS